MVTLQMSVVRPFSCVGSPCWSLPGNQVNLNYLHCIKVGFTERLILSWLTFPKLTMIQKLSVWHFGNFG